jgi:hypothetical protein
VTQRWQETYLAHYKLVRRDASDDTAEDATEGEVEDVKSLKKRVKSSIKKLLDNKRLEINVTASPEDSMEVNDTQDHQYGEGGGRQARKR